MSSKRRTRIRRTAEEAQEEILRAAEEQFIERGPSGLRLKEIARSVGISHPTVLHHFGSREQLVEAVMRKRIENMRGEVLEALSAGLPSSEGVRAILDRLGELFGEGGHARVIAFLALEGLESDEDGLRPIADALSNARSTTPDDDDSYFIVLLIATTLFGEALAGPLFRGLDREAPTPAAFRRWLAELLEPRLRERDEKDRKDKNEEPAERARG